MADPRRVSNSPTPGAAIQTPIDLQARLRSYLGPSFTHYGGNASLFGLNWLLGYNDQIHQLWWAGYDFVPYVVMSYVPVDPISIQVSEELNGPWADAKLNLGLPGDSDVPPRVIIDDPMGHQLYRAQTTEVTRADSIALGFESLLGRMSREKLKASIIARGPFTGKEALEYVLTQFALQHSWFWFKPIPELFLRVGATTIPLKYDAIRIVLDEENPQTLKEVLDEWFAFLPDFAFRVDADNELVVVQVGEGAPVALSDWDVGPIQSEENRLTVVNRCTIRYRPWEFVASQEVMEPADFYIRAVGVVGTGLSDSFFEGAARSHLGKQAYTAPGSASGTLPYWLFQAGVIAAGDITVQWAADFYRPPGLVGGNFSGSAVVPLNGQQVTLFNRAVGPVTDELRVVLKARYIPPGAGDAIRNGKIELEWSSNSSSGGDIYIALNGFSASYAEGEREYKATYGLAEHYPDLPGLAQSQDPVEGVGVVEEERELRIVNLRTDRIFDLPGGGSIDLPWIPDGTWLDNFYPPHQVITQQLLALAKARVQKYFQPRLEYSFPVLAPYNLRPEHLGRYVSLPNGRVGVLTAIGRSDAYGPGQAQEASEARVVEVRSLTEALAALSGYDNAVYEIGRYD